MHPKINPLNAPGFLQRNENGSLILNKQNLHKICKHQGLYEYPDMNKKLYLHYKVIQKIEGLEQYVNLKSLYLENNVITKIENLDNLPILQNLFLQNNMIKKMENLSKLTLLRILDLSNNNIFIIEGLADLLHLQTVSLTKNYLSDFESLEHLGLCSQTMTSLDLSSNKIIADERFFGLIPQVKCLYLSDNPVIRDTNHYRRTMVGRLKKLMYLDQRAVDKEERIMAEAWIMEGQPGFKKAREQIMNFRQDKRKEEKIEIMKNIDYHRKNKINVFESNIADAQKEIIKLNKYKREKGNEDQIYFYQNRIAQLYQQIRQNQSFIEGIYRRLGIPPDQYKIPSLLQEQIRQNMSESSQDHPPSEPSSNPQSATPSQNPSDHSNQTGNSNSSEQQSVKTYYSYDQLD